MEAGICDCHLHPRKAMLSPPCGAERHHPVLRVQVAMRGLPQRAPTTLSQPGSASDCCEALDNWLKSSESQVPPLYRLFFHFLWKSESTRELFFFCILDSDDMRKMLKEASTFLQNFSEESKPLDWVIWRSLAALTDFTSLRFQEEPQED